VEQDRKERKELATAGKGKWGGGERDVGGLMVLAIAKQRERSRCCS
jgi:hypothetical protein